MGRLLALMGSGETSPTMAGIHRDLATRLDGNARAVLLQEPYGFQVNAAAISANAQRYFRDSVGLAVSVIAEPDQAGTAVLRSAGWAFAGPGSPSYALNRWRATGYDQALRDRLHDGTGVTVLASAAAATAGRYALPVYEIYKAGEPPHWLEGLDLLGELGLDVALIPHYDNNEGGWYDTRYCYLGEERLSVLEQDLPDGAAVLGLDEHTAVLVSLPDGRVEVHGRGALTVRRRARSTVLSSGTVLDLSRLQALCRGDSSLPAPAGGPAPVVVSETLMELADRCGARFDEALARRDASGMTRAVLDLESAIRAWAADTEEDEGTEQASAVLRGLVVRLGEAAGHGLRDPREALAPLVEPLVAWRSRLRSSGDFSAADLLRTCLSAGGVEVRDGPGGTEWQVRQTPPI